MTDDGDLLEAALLSAVQAAESAGAMIREACGRLDPASIQAKARNNFVTEIDRASEDALLAALRPAWPGSGAWAEETGASSEAARRGEGAVWIVDPLDGTTNFIHGYPAFSVSIALQLDGELVLGVIHDVMRNLTYRARRGAGAWLGAQRLRTSARAAPESALVCTSCPFREAHFDRQLAALGRVMRACSAVRRGGSAALDLAHLASGVSDAVFDLGLSPWDVAAGIVLVREAGGVTGDFAGAGSGLMDGQILAAATPALRQALVDVLQWP